MQSAAILLIHVLLSSGKLSDQLILCVCMCVSE
jgi:hypothetical protein